MSSTIAIGMTAEELLALPEDGMDRELIRGRLKEKPLTYRSRLSSRSVANLAYRLGRWLEQHPMPRGEIYAGDVGCILRRNPDTVVGIDMAYFSADVMAEQSGIWPCVSFGWIGSL